MEWFLHNPLSALDGPTFLAVFILVIGLLALDAWRRRGADPTEELDPPSIPSKVDPIRVAFLRGGEREVIRLVVFDLLRRGVLRVDDEKKPTRIQLARADTERLKLTPLEQIVADECSVNRTIGALFRPGAFTSRVVEACEPLAASLRDEQLLVSSERKQAALRAALPGLILIPVVAVAKLLMALAKGRHNVGFLLILWLVGFLIMIAISRVPRVTACGRKYLRQLQEAFDGLKSDTMRLAAVGTDPALLLVPAVFGVGLLAGTDYDYVSTLFKKASASSGGGCGGGGCGAGCGGGCGGGGCGGGGCGGGCGGCGG